MKHKKFVSIIKKHQNLIYKICNSYCNSQNQKDLEQEIIIQLWNSFDKYDGRVKISTWIYKIALNTAISYYRKSLVEKKRLSSIDESLFSFSGYDFEMDQNVKLLYQFIEKLNYLDKAIILLYLDNYKYQEISEIIGISKTNVATKINRIKSKLKNQFENVK
ncbi:sigma-70 family RNA polymerase sigma factor [Fulvivirgaceae bacterium BMA10]|uniref:Sigma-70 family RNA polymerase sigma factor n=1 Tax=Splendidivirga corallicola TaxID=3051826 RepID=A0ABT8KLU5_9BACT|nr:sigma-70 family RNA polymerase sigma factor [Fulvivirgaceae bacterium BMA10]